MCLFCGLCAYQKKIKNIYTSQNLLLLFFLCMCGPFFNGSRITSSPKWMFILPTPLLSNDLTRRHLALFDSLRKPKRCEDQSTGLPNVGLNLHRCYMISPGFLVAVSQFQSSIWNCGSCGCLKFQFQSEWYTGCITWCDPKRGKMIWEVIRKRYNGVGAELQEFATMCYRDLRHALLVMIDLILALSGLPGAVTLEDVEVGYFGWALWISSR